MKGVKGMWETNDPYADLEDLIFDKDSGGPSERRGARRNAWLFYGFFRFLLYIFRILDYNISNCLNNKEMRVCTHEY